MSNRLISALQYAAILPDSVNILDDGHIASILPERAALDAVGRKVLFARCSKMLSERLTIIR